MNKKTCMVAIVIIIVVLGIFINTRVKDDNVDRGKLITNTNAGTEIKSDDVEGDDKKSIDNAKQNVYQKNIEIVKQYVDLIYNSEQKADEKFLDELADIADESIVKMFDVEDTSIDHSNAVVTKITHADVTANEKKAMAVYTLKTITDVNENEQDYLLVVSLSDQKISSIDYTAVLR